MSDGAAKGADREHSTSDTPVWRLLGEHLGEAAAAVALAHHIGGELNERAVRQAGEASFKARRHLRANAVVSTL